MRIVLAAVLLAAACPAFAQLVKCVDDRGRTHYTDKPDVDCKGARSRTQLGPAAEPAPKPAPKAPASASPQAAVKPAPKAAAAKPKPKPPAPKVLSAQEQRFQDAECKNAQDMLDLVNGPAGARMENREARIDTLKKRLQRCP